MGVRARHQSDRWVQRHESVRTVHEILRRRDCRDVANVWDGMPLMAHSGAARAEMMVHPDSALEWAPGVRVNAVAPGYVASSGLETYDPAIAGPLVDASIGVTAEAFRSGSRSRRCDRLPPVPGSGIPHRKLYPYRWRRVAESQRDGCRWWWCGATAFRGFHRASEPEVLRNHQSGRR